MIHPNIKSEKQYRDIETVLEEAEGLARAIELDVVHTKVVPISDIVVGSYFGKGTRESVKQDIEHLEPSIVIVNTALSPVQQRNLEKEWNAKVIDRTGLILEIFGARAQTKEGRLQVELAALEYQKSRLVRSWTHLERQRGGAGFMGGPGERQIELDRRMISQKITKLKKDLDDVRRTRDLGRQSRARVPFPIISLVGYTNAGKSSLFNQITDAGVFAEDLPFATLDPTMRRITLPQNQEAILADTVGFIADLPTHLIAAFRATLEQIVHADVILHVIDVSRGDYQQQHDDVVDILEDLGLEYDQDERIIEVYNKIDCLNEEDFKGFERRCRFADVTSVMVSAINGQGVDNLMEAVAEITAAQFEDVHTQINISDGKAIAWLYQHGDVMSRTDHDDKVELSVRMNAANLEKFKKQFKYKTF
ncbi:MAG: GTPase HflX [Alphaproteobacteria bacterium]|nr:GTPase HflX [Alphaproteobacteria bacterium]